MAYTAPPTKAAGDTLTEVNWNTHIKANFEAGVPDVFTTKGDLAVATAANAAARLGIGNNDDTLVADAGEATGLAWQIQPAARVYNSGNIDPAISSWVTLTFDNERFDTNGMHSTVSNTDRITVPANGAGLYLIQANVMLDTSGLGGSGGLYGLRFLLNGTTVIAQNGQHSQAFNATDFVLHLSTLYALSATDYVVVQVYTSQNINVLAAGNYSPEFMAIWQRRA